MSRRLHAGMLRPGDRFVLPGPGRSSGSVRKVEATVVYDRQVLRVTLSTGGEVVLFADEMVEVVPEP